MDDIINKVRELSSKMHSESNYIEASTLSMSKNDIDAEVIKEGHLYTIVDKKTGNVIAIINKDTFDHIMFN